MATAEQTPDRIGRALTTVAAVRIALGSGAYLCPRLSSTLYGLGGHPDPARDYMTRLYGARAVVLGTGYLLSRGHARRMWQRLALTVDILDTVQGGGAGIRGALAPWTAAYVSGFTALTATVGAAKLLDDLRPRST